MVRLEEVTGLVPVEYPTTRRRGASAEDRERDVTAAFSDPEIRAIVTTIGGEDQITVVPHVDPDAVLKDPKPFLGYSDNTNLLNMLWTLGVPAFYGGSTRSTSAPALVSIPCMSDRFAQPFSRENDWRSSNLVSPKITASAGPTHAHSSVRLLLAVGGPTRLRASKSCQCRWAQRAPLRRAGGETG